MSTIGLARAAMSESDPGHSGPATTLAFSSLAFMRPRFLRSDPMMMHLPFLFWLIEVMRPNAVVQLGVGPGAGYFGVCQALDHLGEGATCLGVGGPATGDTLTLGLPTELTGYNVQQYQEFSTLGPVDPSDAIGSIDLLLVNGAAGEIDGAAVDRWVSRLSDRAVVVLHGAPTVNAKRIGDDRPVIETRGGQGLRVVLHGPRQDERLERMAALDLGPLGQSSMWRAFSRLGYGLVAEADAECLDRVRISLKAAEERASEVETQLSELLNTSRGWQERAASLEARLSDLSTSPLSLDGAEGKATAPEARVAELEAEVAALRSAEATRFEELAILASMIEERDAHAARAARQTQPSGGGVASKAMTASGKQPASPMALTGNMSDRLAAMTRRATEAEQISQAMLSSTSWRMTGPVRRIVSLVRRRT